MWPIIAVLAGVAAQALAFWLMTRSSRKAEKELFDEIRNGPAWKTTISFKPTVTTRRIR